MRHILLPPALGGSAVASFVAAPLALAFDVTTLVGGLVVGAVGLWVGRRTARPKTVETTPLERVVREYALDAPFGIAPDTLDLPPNIADSLEALHEHVRDAFARATQAERGRENAEFEAATAGRARSEFLATMSHELRTPLNGSLGMLALLLETELSHEQREFAATARRSSQVLLEMIDEVLDFATLETDRLVLHRTEFKLSKTIWDVVADHSAAAAQRGLGLSYLEEEELPPIVLGDPTRFRQIIDHVLSNAVKFTHEGEIALRSRILSRDDCSLRVGFELSDTGVGIPDCKRDAVFQAFAQVDQSSSRRYSGSGLGLVIVQRLVERMDGHIDFVSEVDHGTTFRFEVVLALPAKQPAVPVRPPLVGPGTRAVLVTSHPSFAEAFEAQLRKLGFHLTTVTDPELALRLRREEPPHVFFVDDTLPNLELHQVRRSLDEEDMPEGCVDVLLHGPHDKQPHSGFHSHMVRPAKPGTLRAFLIDLLDSAVKAPLAAPYVEEPKAEVVDEEDESRRYEGRVLVVEDNAVNRRIVTAQLEKRGIEVETATNGKEALAMLRLICCDLVLMDVQMPEMGGLEATRRIRGGEAGPHLDVPIIALTAGDQPGDRAVCCEVGMNDYIKKPLTAHDLDTVLGNWLRGVTQSDD